MATEIKTWQITGGCLRQINTSLSEHGRREADDLETWIVSEASILGDDIVIIGRQVSTLAGPLDLLGIDKNGNVVVIELKRDRLPREALAQAIDYASDVSTWSLDRLSEECAKFQKGKTLDEVLSDTFDDIDIENLSINKNQRILLVGFGADSSLERMVEWLSGKYALGVNAIILHYTRTTGGDELLTKTAIISEQEEQERIKRHSFKIPMSDDPGEYELEKLRLHLKNYLSSGLSSSRRIRDALLPACLANDRVTREQLVQEFLNRGLATDQAAAGRFISLISSQLGMAKNDFLRQAIGYEYPDYHWQKDNYHIRQGYRQLVEEVLEEIAANASNQNIAPA